MVVCQHDIKRVMIAGIAMEVDPKKDKLARIMGKDDLTMRATLIVSLEGR